MEEQQMREETMYREPVYDVVVYDYGKTGHICPECGTLLTTCPCTDSCPYAEMCEDYQQHWSAGQVWCVVEKEMKE